MTRWARRGAQPRTLSGRQERARDGLGGWRASKKAMTRRNTVHLLRVAHPALAARGWACGDSGCPWRGRQPTALEGNWAPAPESAGQKAASQHSGSLSASQFLTGKRTPVFLEESLGEVLSCLSKGTGKRSAPCSQGSSCECRCPGGNYSQPPGLAWSKFPRAALREAPMKQVGEKVQVSAWRETPTKS